MNVYVDFKDLDAEDMPSSISNKYNLQVRSINGGSEYKNIEIKSLSDYTKQVRKEVCQEIREKMTHWEDCLTKEVTEYVIDKETLDKIEKGE